MDPQSRANLWDHILRLRREMGTTIVLTTHYLEEADSMAERVIVIDEGTVIADNTAAALKRSEEHTSELQSLMRISYAVFCLKKKKPKRNINSKSKKQKKT